METQLGVYLTLFHSRAFSGNQFSRLIKHFGTIEQLQNTSAKVLGELGLAREQICLIHNNEISNVDDSKVNAHLLWAEEVNHHILCYEDQHYPSLLREIDCPPPLLFVQGQPSILRLPQFALVGSRKASSLGRQSAYWISQTLAQCGLSICSGMATGIDSQAHFGALSIGGYTVAILGTGVDRVYPAANRKLAAQISESGALVSEFPLGAPPAANHFPRRNRIISGMSLGLLVVEAAIKSGSLITARTAMEQNREVFAMPGAINNPFSRGCHYLIRDGAKLVETPEDILEELQNQYDRKLWLGTTETNYPEETSTRSSSSKPDLGAGLSITERRCRRIKLSPGQDSGATLPQGYQLSPMEAKILAALDNANCHIDALIRATQLEVHQLTGLLLQLESLGLIQQVAGRYSRL